MRVRHTPGPWKTKPSSKDTQHHYTVAAADGSICNAGNSRRPSHEIEANVRLIASAPDLAEALRDLLVASYEGIPQEMSFARRYAREILEAALGEENCPELRIWGSVSGGVSA